MKMKPFIADIHTHTLASGHAYGTIRENAQAAKEAGLLVYGSSEHAPGIPGTCDPFYFTNLCAVPRELYGVKMIFGSEINVLNGGKLSLEDRFMKCLDYGIVGIHMLCYENEDIEGNTDNVIACMKHKKVFFVSHPDDDHTPLNYERLVQAAKDYHVALEVNNSSFKKGDARLHHVENYKKMTSLCQKLNVPIIVNSDAHDPSAVGDFALARKFLEEVGFDEDLILNTSEKKLFDFIGLKG